jgi:hypothetical protein
VPPSWGYTPRARSWLISVGLISSVVITTKMPAMLAIQNPARRLIRYPARPATPADHIAGVVQRLP